MHTYVIHVHVVQISGVSVVIRLMKLKMISIRPMTATRGSRILSPSLTIKHDDTMRR